MGPDALLALIISKYFFLLFFFCSICYKRVASKMANLLGELIEDRIMKKTKILRKKKGKVECLEFFHLDGWC